MGYKWKPLIRATIGNWPQEVIEASMREYGVSEEETRRRLKEYDDAYHTEYWINDLYQVSKQYHNQALVHLSIRRRDGAACIRDWRHFQLIKNQLVGEECEGIELYPAESRLVDSSNKYHIWCIADPSFRFPIGFPERDVRDENPEAKAAGLKQRRF